MTGRAQSRNKRGKRKHLFYSEGKKEKSSKSRFIRMNIGGKGERKETTTDARFCRLTGIKGAAAADDDDDKSSVRARGSCLPITILSLCHRFSLSLSLLRCSTVYR